MNSALSCVRRWARLLFVCVTTLLLLSACVGCGDSGSSGGGGSSSGANPGSGIAGADQFAAYTAAVHMTSSVNSEEILSQSWSQIGGDAVDLLDSNNSTANFTAPDYDDTLEFELSVTDINGTTISDTITIYVRDIPILALQPLNDILDVDTSSSAQINLALSQTSTEEAEASIELSGTAILGTHYELSIGDALTAQSAPPQPLSDDSTASTEAISVNIPANTTSLPIYISVNDKSSIDQDLTVIAAITAANNADYLIEPVTLTIINDDHQPEFTSAARHDLNESNSIDTQYYATAIDIDGDAISYGLTGGADSGLFSIDTTSGHLQFLSVPSYSEPSDSNQDNIYQLEISASAAGDTAYLELQLVLYGVDGSSAPSVNSSRSASVAEGDTSVFYTLATSDTDGDTLQTAMNGEHSQYFDFGASSGDLRLNSASDYETPQVPDNNYLLTFLVSDDLYTTTFVLSVTLLDAYEPAPEPDLNSSSVSSLSIQFADSDALQSYALYYGPDAACLAELCLDGTITSDFSNSRLHQLTDLAPFSSYYLRTQGNYHSSGVSDISAIYEFSTELSAELDFSAAATGTDSITLAWQPQADSLDPLSYTLYSHTKSCDDEQLLEQSSACGIVSIIATTDTELAIEGLQAGSAYSFRLLGSNATASRWYDNEVSLTTVPLAVDGASISASGIAAQSLTLSWEQPDNGEATTYWYSIEECSSDCSLAYQGQSDHNDHHELSNLTPGALYRFSISARTGEFDTQSTGYLEQSTAPTSVDAIIGASGTSIDLRWSSANWTNTEYWIYQQCSESQQSCVDGFIGSTTEDFYTASELNIGELYQFIVVARADGMEANTSLLSASTIPKVMTANQLVPLEHETSHILELSWTPASQATGYHIYDATDNLTLSVTDGEATSQSLAQAAPGTEYSYKIAAYNNAGIGAASELVSGVTHPIDDLVIESNSSDAGSISVSWSSGNGAATSYQLHVLDCDAGASLCRLVASSYPSAATSATVTGLNPSTDYEYNISASTADKTIYTSNTIVSTEAIDSADFGWRLNSQNQIELVWGSSSQGASGYNIYRAGCSADTSSCGDHSLMGVAVGNSYTDTTASDDQTYSYIVGVTFADVETNSSVIFASLPPQAPEISSTTSSTDSSAVYLQWSGSTNTISFNIYRDAARLTSIDSVAALNDYNDTSAVAGELHSYQVEAVAYFVASTLGTAVAHLHPPLAVTDLAGTTVPDGSVELNWSSVNGSATSFQVWRYLCSDSSYSSCPTPTSVATGLGYETSSYVDTSADPSAHYQYQLSAQADSYEANSSVVNAIKPEVAAASNFLAEVQGSTTVAFSWDAASEHGGYALSATDNLDTLAVEHNLSADQLSHTLDTLTPGEFYTFELNATSAYSSAAVTATAYTDIEPIAFTGFSAVSLDAATINLDNPDGSTVTHTLQLELCGATCEQQNTPSVGTLAVGANQWQLDGLEAGSHYQLTWQVDNHDSSASATTALDPLYTHPAEPTDFAVLEVDSASATIGFRSLNGYTSTTSAHLLDCSLDPCVDSTDANPSFTELGDFNYSYQVTGLASGSYYSLRISVNNNGVIASSAAFDFATQAVAPTDLAITDSGPDYLTVSWNSANAADTTHYLEIELCPDSTYSNCSLSNSLTVAADSSEYNLTELEVDSHYQVRVGAQSSAGAKVLSATSLRYSSASGSVEELAVADLAADGVATLGDHSEVNISFTGQLNLDQNTLVLYLEDCATGTCVATSSELTASDLLALDGDSYQHTIEGLRPGSDYGARLGINVEYGEPGASQAAELNSSAISFTTDYQYPQTTQLVDLNSASVLDFNVSTENGAGVVHHYTLRRCLDQECSSFEYLVDYYDTFVVDSDALPYQFGQQLTGLPPGSLYQVLVVARPPEQAFAWSDIDDADDPCRIASFSSTSGLVPASAYYGQECAHRFTEPAAVYDLGAVTYQQASASYELNYTSDNGGVGIDYYAYILHCSGEQSEGEQPSCVHNGSPYLLDANSSSATLPISSLDAESYLQVIVQTARDVGHSGSDAQELAEVNASAVYFTTLPRAVAAIQIDGVSNTTIDTSWELADDWAVNFGGEAIEEHLYLSSEICSSDELLALAGACGIVERQAVATTTGALTASGTAVDLEAGQQIYLSLVRSNAAGTEVSQSVAVLTQPSLPNFWLSSSTSEGDQATVTINWTDNRANEEIDFYEAYTFQGNCSFSEALANAAKCGGVYVNTFDSSYSGSSYVDPSATETATNYYYYMIAANASGYVVPSYDERKSVQTQYQQKVSNLYYSIDQDSTTFYWSLPDNNGADEIQISRSTGSSIKYLSHNATSYTYDSVFSKGNVFNITLLKNGNSGGTVTTIVSESLINVGIQSPSVTVLDVGNARIEFTPVDQDENLSYEYQIFRHPADADTSCSIDPANCADAVTFSASGLGNKQITYLDELGGHAQDYYYIVREVFGSDSFSTYSDPILAEFDFAAPEITQVFYQYDEDPSRLELTFSWSLADSGERAITQMELFRYTDSGCRRLPDNYSSCNDPALYIDAYSESVSRTTLRYIDELPTTEEYYYRLRAITAARGSELSAEIRVNPHVQLNDSGISRTVYYPSGDSGYASDCQDDDMVGVSDCESGRDAKEVVPKVGSGDETFDYTRIGSDGEPLENQSGSYKSSGNNADGTYWHCVHDNVTGLTWDNYSVVSYTKEYHYNEFSEISTDMNSNAVCGHRDWRIPTVSELLSIRDFGDDDDNYSPDEKVAADTGSLVLIQQGRYWTREAAGDDYYLVDFRFWKQAVQVEPFADDGDHYALLVRGPNLGGTSGVERYYLHPDHHLLIDNNARINSADGNSKPTYGTIAWHPCFLGQSYDPATSECSGSPSEYDDWSDAMAAVDAFTTNSGNYEYRLPNTKEVQTLLDTGAIEDYGYTLHPDTFTGVAALNSSKDYYLWTSSGSVEDDDESFAFRISTGECCAAVDRNNPSTSNNKTYIILPLFISEYVIRDH